MEQKNKVIAYKGFKKDLTCRDFQYEIGKEYKCDGEIKICDNGFHACEDPFDVLNYYGDLFSHRYCEVEQSGKIVKDKEKQASSVIKIKSEIGLDGLLKAGIEWLKNATDPKLFIKDSKGKLNDNGEHGTQIGSNIDYVDIGSSGDCTKIGSSGDYAQIGSSGNHVQIGSSGYRVRINSSGHGAQIGSSGNCAKIGSSGDCVQIGSSGDCARISSNGNSVQIGSSGNYAQISSSGDYTQISSSGDHAQISSNGDHAKIFSTGKNSIICCTGFNSAAAAKIGSWITLSEWDFNSESLWIVKNVKAEYVDGKRIKGDTWYALVNGEFKEVNP